MSNSRRLLVVLLGATALTLPLRVDGIGGNDGANCYSFSDTLPPLDGNAPTFAFADISDSGAALPLLDDQMGGPVPIGFPFNYYGSQYSDVFVSSNGFLSFLPSQSNGCCTGDSIPSPGDPNAIIAGWWEDLYPPGGGAIHYQTLGTAPNRVFVVQFKDVPHYCCSSDLVTMQFKLSETSHAIEVQYVAAPTDGGNHSAGIENTDGTIGIQWQYGTSIGLSDTAVRYFPDVSLSGDADGDGVADCIDNCPLHANSDQADCDGDGIGDACDPDYADTDGDGICDTADVCPSDPTQGCANLFACSGTGSTPSTLYRLNPANGDGFPVGPMGLRGCSGLAFHPVTSTLYAVGFASSEFNRSLWTVDIATGAATLVGPTGHFSLTDLAFRSDGQLFTYHRDATAAGTLSTTTATVALLDVTGFSQSGNGIAFDTSDTLLWAGDATLTSIDQTIGAGTTVAPLLFPPVPCVFPRINSLDVDRDGTLFGIVNCSFGSDAANYLATIAVPSGTVSAIAPAIPGLDGIAFAPPGECGNGVLEIGEQCDDGNAVDGDCCSAACLYESPGTACGSGGSLCTPTTCDGAGGCVGGLPSGCATAAKSILILQDKADDAKDKWLFKWLKGPQTTQSDFGDPRSSTDYALCLYAGPLQSPLAEAQVAAGSATWKALSDKGYKYANPSGNPHGATAVSLVGGTAGKSKVLFKGKGSNLPDPALGSLPLPVTARLVNSETNACFEAVFGTAKKNDPAKFKAKAP